MGRRFQLVQLPFVPAATPGVPPPAPNSDRLVEGMVLEPLPDGMFRVQLSNGVKVLAHVADRLATHFARLRAGDRVVVELVG